MLNDWGIHHLHLGTVLEADGFVTRTGHVLFARFADDEAYFVAVKGHGAGVAGPWTDIEVLKGFARAWPEQMARHELRGVPPSRPATANPSAKDLAKLRKGGVQPLVTIDGKVYRPMGGGISTAKVAVAVVDAMDRHAMAIRGFEEDVARVKEQVFANARNANLDLPRPLRLHLAVRESGEALAVTEDWGFGFPVGKLPMKVR